jgi:hypothetical protein
MELRLAHQLNLAGQFEAAETALAVARIYTARAARRRAVSVGVPYRALVTS